MAVNLMKSKYGSRISDEDLAFKLRCASSVRHAEISDLARQKKKSDVKYLANIFYIDGMLKGYFGYIGLNKTH